MKRIDVVKDKLNQLKALDRRYSIFGSSHHKYVLNRTLSKEELNEVEIKNRIFLSEEYREVIQVMGNGGAGCGYGLMRMNLSKINPPYIGTKELLRNCENPDDLDVDMVELDEISGYIKLFDYGCGMETCLIVNGKEQGDLIFFDCDGAFRKIKEKGLLDIYEGWLDESLEVLKRVRSKLNNKSAVKIIEEEWNDKNYFIREMIYSIMDIDPPNNKNHTEEYKIEIESLRLRWLNSMNISSV